MKKTVDIMNNIIKCKIAGKEQIFVIDGVITEEFYELKLLEDDYKYYINTRTKEKIAIYKEC
jgi:hypothetical protein